MTAYMMIAMTFPIAELRDRNLSPFPMSSNGKYMICSAAVICRILLAINAKDSCDDFDQD